MAKIHFGKKAHTLISILLILSVIFGLLSPSAVTVTAASAAEGEDIRAIIYDGTELVFQSINTEVDSSRDLTYDSYGTNISNVNGSLLNGSTAKRQAIPWYEYADDITTVTFKDEIKPKSTACWFNDMVKLTAINNIENLDTSEVTSMCEMFRNCKIITSIDVSGFDTGSCISIWDMFCGCYKVIELDVSGWDVSNVSGGAGAFYHCTSLTSLDVSSWNTSNFGNIQGMFRECRSLKTLDLSGWDFSTITNMQDIFSSNSITSPMTIESIIFPSGDYDTPNLVQCYRMFYNCPNLTSLDMHGFNFTNVYQAYMMFYCCTALKELDINGLYGYGSASMNEAVSNIIAPNSTYTYGGGIFAGCSSLESLDISKANLAAGKGSFNDNFKTYMFDGTTSLVEITLGDSWKSGFGSLEEANWKRKYTDDDYITQAELIGEYISDYEGTWVAETNIIFYGNGGVLSSQSVQASVGDTISLDSVTDPTRSGFDFEGWYTERSGGDIITPDENNEIVAEQSKYYAHWTEHSYDLVVHGNGGTLDEDVASSLGGTVVTLNEGSDSEEKAVKFSDLGYTEFLQLSRDLYTIDDENYILARWNTNASGSGTDYDANGEVSRLTPDDGGTAHLYAVWQELDATVTYYYQDNEDLSQQTVETRQYSISDDTVIELFEPEYAYHTFKGWYNKSSGGSRYYDTGSSKTVINKDYVLYAQWYDNPLITLNANGGYFDEDETTYSKYIRYNAALGYLPTPENGSKSFGGWFDNTDFEGDEYTSSTTGVTTDLTLYAKWGYKPVINTNGGIISSSVTYDLQDESSYELEELPTVSREGYEFLGWYHGDDLVEAGDTIDLSEDSEIKALWEQSGSYIITLDANGGTVSRDYINVYEDTEIGEIPDPEYEGYDFIGWFENEDGTGEEYDKDTVFTGSTTIYAKWAEKSITLTFNPGDGEIVSGYDSTLSVSSGSTVNELPAAERDSYVLEGWYTDLNDSETLLTKETVITADNTYYAKWDPFYIEVGEVYKYHIGWANTSNSIVTAVGDDLSFHPVSGDEISAILRVDFQMDESSSTLEKGAVKIYVPKSVFTDRDGNIISDTNITNYPKDDDAPGSFLFSYTEEDDYYVFTNNRDFNNSSGTSFNIYYYADPWDIAGGAVDSNGNYVEDEGVTNFENTVKVSMTVDASDDTYDVSDSKDLSVEMHTKVESEASKLFSNYVYYDWQESWGTEGMPDEDNADDYYYVQWILRDNIKTTTAQPYTLLWSEDKTVHDGTLITSLAESLEYSASGVKDTYIITMHAYSDIPDGETWVTLSNEAIVTENWADGYTTEKRVSATAEINIQRPSGSGTSYYKNIYNYKYLNYHYKNGGQEDLLDDNTAVDMVYDLTYNETSNTGSVTWDESSSTYTADERTIEITDGESGDLFISDTESDSTKYTWTGSNQTILGDSDYYFKNVTIILKEYDSTLYKGSWTQRAINTNKSLYGITQLYIRTKDSSDYVLYKTIDSYSSSGSGDSFYAYSTVTLPESAVGIKVKHTSDFFCTYMLVRPKISLLPSDKVNAIVEDDVISDYDTVIKNKSVCDVTTDGTTVTYDDYTSRDSWLSTYVLNVSDTYLYCKKDCADSEYAVDNVATGTVTMPALISGWNYNNSSRSKRIGQCVFNDLLPVGIYVSTGSVVVVPRTGNITYDTDLRTADEYDTYADEDIDSGYYSVSMTDNYMSSGQTMMTVNISVPDDFTYNGLAVTGFDVFYKMVSSYENIYENGVSQENCTSFANTTSGQPSPAGITSSLSDLPAAYQQYYSALNSENYGKIAYAYGLTHATDPSGYSWEFKNTVRGQYSQSYVNNDTIGVGDSYTYKITYTQSENVVAADLVFYDVLEGGTTSFTSEWLGTFSGIDVSSIEKLLSANVSEDDTTERYCAPVIYYSTMARDEFDPDTHYDLSATDSSGDAIWTTEKPDDADITAIAVDCSKTDDGSDMRLSGSKDFSFYISMNSPNDYTIEDYAVTANSAAFNAINASTSNQMSNTSYSYVTLHKITPEISKTASPESGTAQDPMGVIYNSDLNYILAISNPDETMSVYDIVVEDTIPAGLDLLDGRTIKIGESGASVSLSDSPYISSISISSEDSGKKISFTISEIEAAETVYVTIPVKVAVAEGTFENTASIIHVNGTDLETTIESITTYHEVQPYEVRVKKTDMEGELLPGAVLEIYQDTGEYDDFDSRTPLATVDDTSVVWSSQKWDDDSSVLPGAYVLVETTTPDGYVTADSMVFTIDTEGIIRVIGTADSTGTYTELSAPEVTTYVTMVNNPVWAVYFHINDPRSEHDDSSGIEDDYYKIYKPSTDENDELYVQLSEFYDIPTFGKDTDEYVFNGWYTSRTDGEAISYSDRYTQETHCYAQWTKVGTVEKDSDDEKQFTGNYRGFGTIGVQIRAEGLEDYNYGDEILPGGLRFVTSFSESLLEAVDALSESTVEIEAENTGTGESVGVEYGYIVGTQENINLFISHYGADSSEYEILYKGENSNGEDTTVSGEVSTDYRYITNYNCTKGTGDIKLDHRNYDEYRLFTFVVTYEDDEDNKDKKIDARAYMRYTDANGLVRIFYNTYKYGQMYGGCLVSYNDAYNGLY